MIAPTINKIFRGIQMVPFTLKQALAACGGIFAGGERLLEQEIKGVTIDSRTVCPGFLFVPIKGENHDGHDFIPKAREAGALCCLTEKPLETEPYILVNSALDAFQDIAAFYRSLFDIPVVGITGSAGKTTTKELIAGVLEQKYSVLKNEGNFNNQTGVPITVLRLDHGHEAAVIEMGTNHFGEISRLSRIVRPGVCVLTNIGEAHLEFLGSKEGILKAKSEMFEYMKPGGHVVINGDDPLLASLVSRFPDAVTFGLKEGNKVRAKDIVDLRLDGVSFTVSRGEKETKLHVASPGEHMVLNALAALAVGEILGVGEERIRRGISGFEPASGRMHVTETDRITILNDAYNANPTSMAASISIAAKAKGRKVCILGDMFELGENEAVYHKGVGYHAAKEGIDLIVCVGELSGSICEAALERGANALHFKDTEALTAALPQLIETGDTVLVKASHGMHLETVAEWLKENM
jgi:UDP-N-acetylmuramoyl-tripeptide--D-alanyl-D-alanine ligase